MFTDEPSILPAGGLPWTDDLPQQFQQRWGYSLLEHLPGLVQPVGDWQRLRHNYFQVLLDLYIERWAKPYFEYCQRNNLELTGHYLEHEWPTLIHTPDYMAMEAWEHRPGIDILMNQFQEADPRAQFGNVRIVKEIGSVANQLALPRTLSETYAGSGHEIRFEEMKRQGDWAFVLGLNTLNECLSQVSMRGVRKGNWPRSLSYHNPWWEAYHVLEDYFTRLSAATSHGRQVNDILVLEPTTTAWMHQNDKPALDLIGTSFQSLLNDLERNQVEYDLGSEDILARHGSISDAQLAIGPCRYRIVVLPPGTENLNDRTVELLSAGLREGVRVFCGGPPPGRVNGQSSSAVREIASSPAWKTVAASALPTSCWPAARTASSWSALPDDGGRLFHQRRKFEDGELLLLVNTAIDSSLRGTLRTPARGVEQWCLDTGQIMPFPFTAEGEGVTAPFELPPCGSLLLFLTHAPLESPPSALPQSSPPSIAHITPLSPPAVHRLDDNVLVLDYLQWKTGDENTDVIHCREATRRLFTRHGFQGNPWFEAVQFADEHIRQEFPAETAFEVTYRFTIAESVPPRLCFVVERPELYESITCNGQPMTPLANSWWLDRAFGKLDVRAAAHVGENLITLKAARFTVLHELEPAYLLGDFCLRDAERGFHIVPETVLKMDREQGWNAQGHPFYGGGVAYREDFEVSQPAGRYRVVLTNWFGSVAKVLVNGQPAGYIGWQPWECDVTELVQPGRNQVEVVVFGSLRNTLGPFHAGPPQGIVTPQMFNQAPTAVSLPAANTRRYGMACSSPSYCRWRSDRAEWLPIRSTNDE